MARILKLFQVILAFSVENKQKSFSYNELSKENRGNENMGMPFCAFHRTGGSRCGNIGNCMQSYRCILLYLIVFFFTLLIFFF